MGLSATYDLRTELARMNDVADFVDTFGVLLSWVPTVTAGAMGITATTITGRYRVVGNVCKFYLRLNGDLSATLADRILFTLPVTADAAFTEQPHTGRILQPGQYAEAALCFNISLTQAGIFRALGGDMLAGSYETVISGSYFI